MNHKTVINSAEFRGEQKEYLRGFFAGIAQRGPTPFVGHTADGLITNDPASGLSFCYLTNGLDQHQLREWRRTSGIASRAANCVVQ